MMIVQRAIQIGMIAVYILLVWLAGKLEERDHEQAKDRAEDREEWGCD